MESKQWEKCVYKEMYYHLAKASEDALRQLIKGQQECEDILLNSESPCQEHTTHGQHSGC